MGPILLDPGSRAFDDPEACGYKLLYKNLEEYVEALSLPSWHQWLNYETELLDRAAIIELIQRSMDFVIDQREAAGFYSGPEAHYERCRLEADRVVVETTDALMHLEPAERQDRIVTVRKNLDQLEKTRMSFLE